MRRETMLASAAAAMALGLSAAPAVTYSAPAPQTKPKRKRGMRTGSGGRVLDRAYANLSWKHPDYGCTPAEHEARKQLRAEGKLPFVDKEELARKRGGMAKAYGL